MALGERRKIGLALGGGGARGLAHIGVLKVLRNEGIPVDCISGTSMGGIVGAMAAAGLSVLEMEKIAFETVTKPTDALKLLDVSLSQNGLIKGSRVYDLMASTIGPTRTFADLQHPLAVVAVDVLTGREVVLRDGLVADAIRATISVPGVFVPVTMGPYRLVDGGVLNNVPVDVARQLGADVVIAVDVLPNFGENEPGMPPKVHRLHTRQMPRALRGLWAIQTIMISALTEYRLKETQPELILRPELPTDMDLFLGFDRPEIAIAAGVRAAQHALPQLRALMADD